MELRSIKTKLVLLLVGISAVPLIISIITLNTISDTSETAHQQILTTVGLSLLLLAPVAFIAFTLAGRIADHLAAISHTATEISKGNLSLPKLPVTSEDELGQMAAAFNNMVDKLSTALKSTTESALSVVSSSQELHATSEQSAAAANQIATAASSAMERVKEQKEAIVKEYAAKDGDKVQGRNQNKDYCQGSCENGSQGGRKTRGEDRGDEVRQEVNP